MNPVSYTHLDVYKRQILDTVIRVALNTVTDGGGYEDITRKVYLFSLARPTSVFDNR